MNGEMLNGLVVRFCKMRNSGDQLHNFGSGCNHSTIARGRTKSSILCCVCFIRIHEEKHSTKT